MKHQFKEEPQFGTKEFNILFSDLCDKNLGGKPKQATMSEAIKQVITDKLKQETLEDACDRVLNYLYPNCKKEMSSLQYGNSINSLKSIAKWQQERSYSEEDMEIIEISSIDANYIPHYQTKEGQLLATKFNVKLFKNK